MPVILNMLRPMLHKNGVYDLNVSVPQDLELRLATAALNFGRIADWIAEKLLVLAANPYSSA